MKIVGILTEFHPFHCGHAYFLEQVRRAAGEDCGVVCIMSGNFVQRGTPALLEKWVRAEAALRGGADLVLELPVARSAAAAERFAEGAVSMMRAAGCITALAFGSECGDEAALGRIAACLDTAAYRAALKGFLNQGRSFAACRQAAVEAVLGREDAALLSGANNSLGVEYLKAARRQGWDCEVITVRRRGAGHDSMERGAYLSGTAVRALLEREDWPAVERAVPPAAAQLYRRAFAAGRAPVTAAAVERMMLARLRTMDEADFAALPDCGEGLEYRFCRAAQEAGSLAELLAQVKTKRYALARLRRIALCAWLEIDRAAAAELPAYLRVLGCTPRGREILGRMRRTAVLPVLTKPADVKTLSPLAQKQFRREAAATERYALLFPSLAEALPAQEWRSRPVILESEAPALQEEL